MSENISKTNESLDFFNARLDAIRMSDEARIAAKASLAQAEAVTDAVFECIGFATRLLKSLAARPQRGPTEAAS